MAEHNTGHNTSRQNTLLPTLTDVFGNFSNYLFDILYVQIKVHMKATSQEEPLMRH